ncbi:MAG: hypothetical protein ABL917_01935 [Parcubacteria group bacterium]
MTLKEFKELRLGEKAKEELLKERQRKEKEEDDYFDGLGDVVESHPIFLPRNMRN